MYKTLEAKDQFLEMRADGWFPFIEILGGEYNELSKIYTDRFNFEARTKAVINNFNESTLQKITTHWWRHSAFEKKRALIQAGINAYLQGTEDGYINCNKNLSTEIEGILRQIYFVDTGKGASVKSHHLIAHIIDKGGSVRKYANSAAPAVC
jgi:hypothetical protein